MAWSHFCKACPRKILITNNSNEGSLMNWWLHYDIDVIMCGGFCAHQIVYIKYAQLLNVDICNRLCYKTYFAHDTS